MTSEHYRKLLTDLAAVQQDRLRAKEALQEFETDQALHLPQKIDQALRAANSEFQNSKDEIDESWSADCQALDEERRAREAAAQAEHVRGVSEIEKHCQKELAVIEQKFNDSTWLLQSMLDDTSENSPKRQFDRLKSNLVHAKTRLAAQQEEITGLYQKASKLARRRWQRVDDDPAAEKMPQSLEEAEQAQDAAAAAVRQAYSLMMRQFVPRIFSMWPILLLLLVVVGGGLFAGLSLFVKPQWVGLATAAPKEWMAISGGAAFTVCLILVFILWQITSRQTSAVFEPIQQQAINIHSWYQRWLKASQVEFKRQEKTFLAKHASIVERRDQTLQQYTAERDAKIAELEATRQQTLKKLAQDRDAALKSAEQEYNQRREARDDEYQAALTAWTSQSDETRNRLTHGHEQEKASRDRQRQDLVNQFESPWKSLLAKLNAESAALEEESHQACPPWDQITEGDWKPPELLPSEIRLGDYRVSVVDPVEPHAAGGQMIPFPAALPFPDAPSLLLKAQGTGRDEAVEILQIGMLRFLTQLPAGVVRFTICDAVGLGENFAAFMHLADFDDLLITSRIWTEPGHIEEQLSKLTEHMENVFQKYLRNEFESIEEYNQFAGEVAEPYRLLVVANFPAGFTERAAQKLTSVASSGARCGVHLLVSVDTQQPMPRGFDLSRLEEVATVLEWKTHENAGAEFQNVFFGKHAPPFVRDSLPPAAQWANVIRKLGEFSKDVRRVEVPFYRIAPPREEFWTADSRAGIDVPLGRAGATKLQHLQLGKGTSQHVLMAGKTGSGKSTLMHVIITDLALRYSPDEIHFYLIDFKKGVEFKTYADHKLPHARVIAIESDREFGASVLGRLDTILSERGELFRDVGAQDIKSFRAARPDVPMPRILLLVDEFQEFFTEDDKYSQIASQLIDRLVRQGRAFGMHVLLGSQSLGGAYALPRTTIGQMAVRIALQCSESDAHQILSESNGAARLLTRPGEAIYNNANGLLEGNSPFQVAWLDDKQRDGFLDQLEEMYEKLPAHWPEPIVFEGNIPADPAVNEPLVQLLAAAADGPPLETKPRAWLGDAVAIAGPVEIRFFRRSGTNLLLVGQDEEGALGILGTCIPTLASQDIGRIDLFADFNNPANEERWSPILTAVKHHVRRSGPEEVGAVLNDYAAELARRQETPGDYRSWFLVIDDLSRFRELRKSDDDFGFGGMDRNKTQSPSQIFSSLLKEGPAVGIHLLIWVDSYNNVDRWFSRQMLREFDMRAVFQMSANDSSNLIDSPAAAKLGNNRALLYSDERGTAEKFRPYQPPAPAWLSTFTPHALPEPPPAPAPQPPTEAQKTTDEGNGTSPHLPAAVDDLSGWNVK